MSKEEFEQRLVRKSLRETLSAVEERVGELEGSMEDIKEALDGVEGRIDNWKEQSRDYVKISLDSTMDQVNELFNSHDDKMSKWYDALAAMMMALKEETMATTLALSKRVEELEGELVLCRVAVVNGVSSAALKKDKLGSSKSEKRGVCEGNHEGDKDDGNGNGDNSGNGKPRVGKKEPKRKRDKRKCFLCDGPHILKNCPKKFALKKKPVVKALGLGSNARGVEAKEADNEKKLVECFLCNGPHRLRKCLIKSSLKEKPGVKALGLGSSARGVEAKEVESEKKPVECFLCHGPHRLRNYPRKSALEGNDRANKEPKKLGSSKGKVEAKRVKKSKFVIEGIDGADKEPKKLGSSKGEAEAKRAKRSKKKQVKCFLCRGPHELRNCPKKAVVKGKATSEQGESSEGLSPKEEVSLSSNSEKEVAMKTVKLGPMRLKSNEALELAESSTRLPPMGEVGDASDFKEKEVMHEGQLTRVNAEVHSKHLKSVLRSNLLTWQERRGPFEVLEQGGQETVGEVKPSAVNQEDSVRGKLERGQGSDITPCHRDVRTSRTARSKKRRKPRQNSRKKGEAKATRRDRGESSQCHSGAATRTLREWVGENVTGQSSKPVTIEPNASDGGLLLRWGSFGPRELAQFKELLEKPVKLKPGWPDSEDMAT
ncbi:hypothetical protein J1N35_019546 [Gossypium stocksii]|uniref:Uncharacterized protein n=1 Tax=Gossypium stocksii TaxID=47602 RepID=A0A9D4A779_9ROSI|nr:hypothetical protein J1N35_019546 [Gossypium stocksii]